jgi:dienelactone hydrolase
MRLIVLVLILSSCVVAAQSTRGAKPSTSGATTTEGATTRAAFLKLIDRPRVPLDDTTRRLADLDESLTQEAVSFAADEKERVPALVVQSRLSSGRRPVVVVLHGTNGSKEQQVARLAQIARRGFVAVAIDGRYHGERQGRVPGPSTSYVNAILAAYRSGQAHPFVYDTVWDVMRLIDYLETRDDVDATRIGLTGQSVGGMETYVAAAIEPRIAVAVPIIGVQNLRWSLDHGAWDSRVWTFRAALDAASKDEQEVVSVDFVRKFYDRVAPGIYGEFDGPALLPLIAPRPLLVINGDSDPRTPMAGVKEAIAAAQRAYREAGAQDRLLFHIQPDAGHEVTPEADAAALDWFVKWLKPQRS